MTSHEQTSFLDLAPVERPACHCSGTCEGWYVAIRQYAMDGTFSYAVWNSEDAWLQRKSPAYPGVGQFKTIEDVVAAAKKKCQQMNGDYHAETA